MKIMKNYKVEAVYDNSFLLTAVVACEKAEDSFKIAGFDGEDYSEKEAVWIGDSIYSEPTLICCESL